MFGGLGPGEIFLIVLVLLLIFGAKRLPELGGALGKGIREFKSSVRDAGNELSRPEPPREVTPPPAAPRATLETPRAETQDRSGT
jgi:sec-independent protein translocase protein TatA